MSDLVERLRKCANESWPYAQCVSNLKRPETDNDFGRATVAMREAADTIESLQAKLEVAREALEEVINSGLLQGSYTIHNEANKAVHKALQIILIEESKDEPD